MRASRQQVIVSLTSFPSALPYAAQAIRSVLRDSLLSDKIVLYLDTPLFPGDILPADIDCQTFNRILEHYPHIKDKLAWK